MPGYELSRSCNSSSDKLDMSTSTVSSAVGGSTILIASSIVNGLVSVFSCILIPRLCCYIREYFPYTGFSCVLFKSLNPVFLCVQRWITSGRFASSQQQDCYNCYFHCFRHYLWFGGGLAASFSNSSCYCFNRAFIVYTWHVYPNSSSSSLHSFRVGSVWLCSLSASCIAFAFSNDIPNTTSYCFFASLRLIV